jgi:hypothetical protein
VLKPAKIKHILVAPDNIAEWIAVKQGPEDTRNLIREIKNRQEVKPYDIENLNQVLDIPEISTNS